MTDAKLAGISDPGAVNGLLRVTSSTMSSPDDSLTTSKLLVIPSSDTANVDHLIPRVDSNGCDCGSNDSSNALVLSSQLNTKMGRNCLDPNRIEILEKFTYLPSTAHEATPTVESETQTVEVEGGCSTGTGQAGGLLLLLGMLGFSRARKRR